MNITTISQSLLEVQADLLAVAVTESNLEDAAADLNAAFGGTLLSALEADDFTGKIGSSASYPTFGNIAAKKLLIVGAGDGSANGFKRAAGAAGKAAAATTAAVAGAATSKTGTRARTHHRPHHQPVRGGGGSACRPFSRPDQAS